MRTKTAIICFYQVKNSYHGAAEVSLGLFNSWPSKKKKLFELKDWHLLVSKNKKIQLFFHYFNSYLIKPINIIILIKKVLNYLDRKKNFVVIEGASWIGFSYLTILILKFFIKDLKVFYHAHNIEYDIRINNNCKLISFITKILEKKVYKISDYASAVSSVDAERIQLLYKIKPLIFSNGIDYNRLKINKKNISFISGKYIIYTGNYYYKPNRIAINRLVYQILPRLSKKIPDIKLVITGGGFEKIKNNKKIIYKNNIPKNILNYCIEKSYFIILPMTNAPGTKIKTIESLMLGKIVLGSKFAFKGIKVLNSITKSSVFIYSNNKDMWSKINFIIKNYNIIKNVALKNKKFYIKNYSMKNITNHFIYENKIK
jgi:hypothetical protein